MRKNAVKLAILHNYHALPHQRAVQNAVDEGKVGDPYFIRTEGLGGHHYPGTPSYNSDWRTQSKLAGGGCWIDNGYHQIYCSVAAMKSPVEAVSARIGTFYHSQDVEDLAVVMLHHANGGTTSLQVGWCAPGGGQRVYEIHGTGGSIYTNGRDGNLEWFDNKSGERQVLELPEGAPGGAFREIFESFIEYLETGLGSYPGAREALDNLAVIEAAYESSRTGKVVRVLNT